MSYPKLWEFCATILQDKDKISLYSFNVKDPNGITVEDLMNKPKYAKKIALHAHHKELWVKSIQQQAFSNKYESLVHNKKDVSFKQLNLFLDDPGIIRCKGRFGMASVPSYVNDPISTLIIRDHLYCRQHNGIRDTLNSVKGTYWIIRGQEVVKRVIRKCVVCLRTEVRPYPCQTSQSK